MKYGIKIKLDVSKIDKARLFAGQKGKYLDATVFVDIDELDQYGNNGMITQDVSKEEKQQGVKGNILGNCKVFWNDSQQQTPQQARQQAPQQGFQQAQQGFQQQQVNTASGNQSSFQQAPPQEPSVDFDDDLPF